MGHSDTDETSVVHVPSLQLVVAGDVIYNGVHQYLAESAGGGRDACRNAIDIVEGLRPRLICRGPQECGVRRRRHPHHRRDTRVP